MLGHGHDLGRVAGQKPSWRHAHGEYGDKVTYVSWKGPVSCGRHLGAQGCSPHAAYVAGS